MNQNSEFEYITDEVFNSLLQQQLTMHKEYFAQKDITGYSPMLHVFAYEKGKEDIASLLMLLILPGMTEEDFRNQKEKLIFSIGARLAEEDKFSPIAVFMSSEAWQREFVSDEQQKEFERTRIMPPVEALTTIEILMTQGLTYDLRVNAGIYKILRDKDDKIQLGELTTIEYKSGEKKESQAYLLENFYRGFAEGMRQRKKAQGGTN